MTNGLFSYLDDGQGNSPECPQQAFRCRLLCLSRRIAGIKAGQCFSCLAQLTTSQIFDKGQNPQGKRQQADHSHGMIIPLNIQWSDSQRMSFQPRKVAFNGRGISVNPHRLCQGEPIPWGVGCIKPPSQPSSGGDNRLWVSLNMYHIPYSLFRSGGQIFVRPDGTPVAFWQYRDGQKLSNRKPLASVSLANMIVFQNLFNSELQQFFVLPPAFPPTRRRCQSQKLFLRFFCPFDKNFRIGCQTDKTLFATDWPIPDAVALPKLANRGAKAALAIRPAGHQ